MRVGISRNSLKVEIKMVQQVYTVMVPGGVAYRITVEIRDEPIVASRGGKSLALDPDWVKAVLDQFLEDNKRYNGVVTYFAGYLRCLKYLGVISDVEYEEIPPAASAPKTDEPTPLWAAWGRI